MYEVPFLGPAIPAPPTITAQTPPIRASALTSPHSIHSSVLVAGRCYPRDGAGLEGQRCTTHSISRLADDEGGGGRETRRKTGPSSSPHYFLHSIVGHTSYIPTKRNNIQHQNNNVDDVPHRPHEIDQVINRRDRGCDIVLPIYIEISDGIVVGIR